MPASPSSGSGSIESSPRTPPSSSPIVKVFDIKYNTSKQYTNYIIRKEL